MTKTTKKTIEQPVFKAPDYFDEGDYKSMREEALERAIELFRDTPFKEMLVVRNAGGSTSVADVPFYQVTMELYNFLKFGNFDAYEQFKKNAKAAA